MKDDVTFKAFFSKAGHEKYLKDFLTSIIEEEIKIKNITHDANLEQLAKTSKYGILDLNVELETGEQINVEMQLKNYFNIEERTTYYASKKITEQLGPKEDYNKLKKVIIIAILDYDLTPLQKYITKTVRVVEEDRYYELNNIVTYYYIELSKFRRQNPDMTKKENQWLSLIDMEREDLLEMAMKNNKIVKEAYGEYKVLTGEACEKRLAELRMIDNWEKNCALRCEREQGKEEGITIGEKIGKKRGIELGQRKEKIELTKKMLKLKMSVEQIKEITGLSEEEIKKIEKK
ncbi:MAG: Rpn family recombination-promoting nuclease/putative transposase [Clostridia bacterium]|jgi:predicted transposase/invertase (TIGR01784 family)|nr:Rpn family recombination-promoting nuclease/putative transposase [Clostridia bacterium]